jgi:hypothetical protein
MGDIFLLADRLVALMSFRGKRAAPKHAPWSLGVAAMDHYDPGKIEQTGRSTCTDRC